MSANQSGPMNSHLINYDAMRRVMAEEAPTPVESEQWLLNELPYTWREHYERMTSRPVRPFYIPYNEFTYYYDHYTDQEMKGAVEFSAIREDRVIGVIGRSIEAASSPEKASKWLGGLIGGTEAIWGVQYDKGHFMARAMGGGEQVNIFPQRRDLNRGRSPQGRVYRDMEKYCIANLGTLCFHRPIYLDESFKPVALDYGYLSKEGELVTERFDNSEILIDGKGFETKLPKKDPRNWWFRDSDE